MNAHFESAMRMLQNCYETESSIRRMVADQKTIKDIYISAHALLKKHEQLVFHQEKDVFLGELTLMSPDKIGKDVGNILWLREWKNRLEKNLVRLGQEISDSHISVLEEHKTYLTNAELTLTTVIGCISVNNKYIGTVYDELVGLLTSIQKQRVDIEKRIVAGRNTTMARTEIEALELSNKSFVIESKKRQEQVLGKIAVILSSTITSDLQKLISSATIREIAASLAVQGSNLSDKTLAAQTRIVPENIRELDACFGSYLIFKEKAAKEISEQLEQQRKFADSISDVTTSIKNALNSLRLNISSIHANMSLQEMVETATRCSATFNKIILDIRDTLIKDFARTDKYSHIPIFADFASTKTKNSLISLRDEISTLNTKEATNSQLKKINAFICKAASQEIAARKECVLLLIKKIRGVLDKNSFWLPRAKAYRKDLENICNSLEMCTSLRDADRLYDTFKIKTEEVQLIKGLDFIF